MSLPTSLSAYVDCVEVFERAMESDWGVSVRQPDITAARYFRMRLHQARVYHRREASRMYDKTDPKWGKSPWDVFVVKLEEGEDDAYVIVERLTADRLEIEELPGDRPLVAHEPQRALPPPAPPDDLPEATESEAEPEPAPVVNRRF